MTPEQRAQRVTAAHASWARTPDRAARSAPGFDGLEARIAREYGIPDDMPNPDRAKALASARTAYFRKLAAKSVKARARRKQVTS